MVVSRSDLPAMIAMGLSTGGWRKRCTAPAWLDWAVEGGRFSARFRDDGLGAAAAGLGVEGSTVGAPLYRGMLQQM